MKGRFFIPQEWICSGLRSLFRDYIAWNDVRYSYEQHKIRLSEPDGWNGNQEKMEGEGETLSWLYGMHRTTINTQIKGIMALVKRIHTCHGV